jgi:hypothetical protein
MRRRIVYPSSKEGKKAPLLRFNHLTSRVTKVDCCFIKVPVYNIYDGGIPLKSGNTNLDGGNPTQNNNKILDGGNII